MIVSLIALAGKCLAIFFGVSRRVGLVRRVGELALLSDADEAALGFPADLIATQIAKLCPS
jgi:hypothetical protein